MAHDEAKTLKHILQWNIALFESSLYVAFIYRYLFHPISDILTQYMSSSKINKRCAQSQSDIPPEERNRLHKNMVQTIFL